jgi:hypothetical protein
MSSQNGRRHLRKFVSNFLLLTVLEEILVTNWWLNWSVISPKLCLLSERSIRYIILSPRTPVFLPLPLRELMWTVRNHWKKVIFSDETKIEIGNNRKVYVWRKVNERLRPECNGLYQGRNYKTGISFSVFHWFVLRDTWHGALSSWNM